MMHAPIGRLALGVLLHGSGGHWAGWRHPQGAASGQLDYPLHAFLAMELERGRIDAIFRPDLLAPWGEGPGLNKAARADHFEPLTLLSGLAGATQHLGLVATGSTTYWPADRLARRFASLDTISGGRAGWNIVTSYHLARELATLDIMSGGRAGLLLDPQPDATERATGLLVRQEAPAARRRAEEYLGVLQGLWDSFDDDAFVHDRATGVCFRADGMHPLDHDGPHYRVAGPLNIARPPQGHPVTLAAWVRRPGRTARLPGHKPAHPLPDTPDRPPVPRRRASRGHRRTHPAAAARGAPHRPPDRPARRTGLAGVLRRPHAAHVARARTRPVRLTRRPHAAEPTGPRTARGLAGPPLGVIFPPFFSPDRRRWSCCGPAHCGGSPGRGWWC
ncbi:LLM class flavin-dependent oxidoreductase [Streptomyces sp. NPDC088810]|uniref:LLM class flavin-dependent oxidoreductase n=1 Tax=Streptomyces sp. NPDC088810 TaxID=3365904 RepID=UPI0038106108